MRWPIGRLHKRASIIIATRTGAVNTKIRFFQSASSHLLFSPVSSLILSIAKPPFHFKTGGHRKFRSCRPRWGGGTAGRPKAHGPFAPPCHRRFSAQRWGEGACEGLAVGQRQWSGPTIGQILSGREAQWPQRQGGRPAVHGPFAPQYRRCFSARRWGDGTRDGLAVGRRQWSGPAAGQVFSTREAQWPQLQGGRPLSVPRAALRTPPWRDAPSPFLPPR